MKKLLILLAWLPFLAAGQIDYGNEGTSTGSTDTASLSNRIDAKAPQTAVDTLPGDNELTNKLALKIAVADSTAGTGHYASNYDLATAIADLNYLKNATNYYINSISGHDTADGLTPSSAWQTITRVNAYTHTNYALQSQTFGAAGWSLQATANKGADIR